MATIELNGLTFHAFHGVYEEEQKNGNTFVVDVNIKTNISKSAISDNLDHTVDYVEVYKIIKNEMDIPSQLLENVVYRINTALSAIVKKASIKTTLYKMNPPLGGKCNYSAVTLKLKTK